jgi:hypothetical protein
MEKKNKTRKTVNVSLGKRHPEQLNNILNNWEDEGYNISNEICKAILFREKYESNPHICTILSTLSLINSSLKSQKQYSHLSQDEIDAIALEIFNEVITINIDGNKLTHLLKGEESLYRKDINFNQPTKENINNRYVNNQNYPNNILDKHQSYAENNYQKTQNPQLDNSLYFSQMENNQLYIKQNAPYTDNNLNRYNDNTNNYKEPQNNQHEELSFTQEEANIEQNMIQNENFTNQNFIDNNTNLNNNQDNNLASKNTENNINNNQNSLKPLVWDNFPKSSENLDNNDIFAGFATNNSFSD